MNVHTHWLGGFAAGVALAAAAPAHALVLVTAATLAAPLPDLDHPGSAYGRWVPLPGVARIHGRVEPYRPGPFGNAQAAGGQVGRATPFGLGWHRGGMHSLVAAGLAAGIVGTAAQALWPGQGVWVALGVLAGMLSHLALDALNVMGQAWFWPFSRRRWRLRWPRIRVGSAGEGVVALLLLGGLALAFHAWAPRLLAALVIRRG